MSSKDTYDYSIYSALLYIVFPRRVKKTLIKSSSFWLTNSVLNPERPSVIDQQVLGIPPHERLTILTRTFRSTTVSYPSDIQPLAEVQGAEKPVHLEG